jgi:glutamate--cysteine ligase
MVPHLTTALTGPLLELERRFLAASPQIEHWLRGQWLEHTPPFYSSVDLRNAGFKLAPVDTNLFPGGFNNLNAGLPAAVRSGDDERHRESSARKRATCCWCRRTTRATCSICATSPGSPQILKLAGLNVRIGSLLPDLAQPTTSSTWANGHSLLLEPLIRLPGGRRIGVEGFDPCAILLNNDLSAGVHELLRGVHEQTFIPPLHAGWTTRRKSQHFEAYSEVARASPRSWTSIRGSSTRCTTCAATSISRNAAAKNAWPRASARCLPASAKSMPSIRVEHDPFVIVKADAGTYGMGIMTVRDPSEVVGLNRKQRNKMAVVKEGMEVSSVMIQEGVPTFETVDGGVAEPVVYMMDRYVVGGFYRVHGERGATRT